MQAMWKHRRAIVERGPGGRFGRRGLLDLALFQTLMPLLSPLIDVFLIYGLFVLGVGQTLASWFAVLGLQTLSTIYAFRLDKESLWRLPLQQFAYRQLMYLVLIQSTLAALGGIRLGWQKPRRTGGLNTLMGARVPRP